MIDPIPLQLARLRDAYALYLARLEWSDMDPLFRRSAMKQVREGIDELDRQIANEEQRVEPLQCDVDAYKRMRERG